MVFILSTTRSASAADEDSVREAQRTAGERFGDFSTDGRTNPRLHVFGVNDEHGFRFVIDAAHMDTAFQPAVELTSCVDIGL